MNNRYRIQLEDEYKRPDVLWIEVEETSPGVFSVIDENLTDKGEHADNFALGMMNWDDEVVDLDNDCSDESQCFGMSTHLRWHDVDLMVSEFHAPSIERLREALTHVSIGSWCPWDI